MEITSEWVTPTTGAAPQQHPLLILLEVGTADRQAGRQRQHCSYGNVGRSCSHAGETRGFDVKCYSVSWTHWICYKASWKTLLLMFNALHWATVCVSRSHYLQQLIIRQLSCLGLMFLFEDVSTLHPRSFCLSQYCYSKTRGDKPSTNTHPMAGCHVWCYICNIKYYILCILCIDLLS